MLNIKYVVWDFDGVINNSIIDGRFVWTDNFEADIGMPLAPFTDLVFNAEFNKVICGEKDLLDHIEDWATQTGYSGDPRQILDYWLEKDALPDKQILEFIEEIEQTGARNVIATNNEKHRASYIEDQIGFGSKVDEIFASGRMKCAKPDQLFFEHVSRSLNVDVSELILIDDNLQNTKSANALGWKTHHFKNSGYDSLRRALGLS